MARTPDHGTPQEDGGKPASRKYSSKERFDQLRSHIKGAKQNDRQALRDTVSTLESNHVDLTTQVITVDLLRELYSKSEKIHNPNRYARRGLLCLDRLIKANNTLKMIQYEPVEDRRIHTLPEEEWPHRLFAEIEAWVDTVPKRIEGQPNPKNALGPRAVVGYKASAATMISTLHLLEVPFSHDLGLADILEPDVAQAIFDFLATRMRASTVQTVIAGTLRIARDLGIDPKSIRYLEARLAEIMKGSLEIDPAPLAQLTQPKQLIGLLAVPNVLMAIAEDASRLGKSRLAAGRSAVVFQLMLEHFLSEEELAQFHLDSNISEIKGQTFILHADGLTLEPVSPEAEKLLKRLHALLEKLEISSRYLIPGNDGLHRETRAALEMVYEQIQGVLGTRYTRSDFRDLRVHVARLVPGHDSAAIAKAAGYKHARSLRRRHGPGGTT